VPEIPKRRERAEIPGNALILRVYVASHCPNCQEARRLAQVVGEMVPHLTVEIIDMDRAPALSSKVFAVPTYEFNGHVCFLGNPSQEKLIAFLRDWLESERLILSEQTEEAR
jgi:hypothetical protein